MRRARSVRTRILLALMQTTLLTLTIATGLSALMDLSLFRDHLLRDLRVLAAVVGENSAAALAFNSPESAEENLATLSVEPQVRAAVIYDADGVLFARWQAAERAADGPAGPAVELEHLIRLDGEVLGRLVLDVRLSELASQARTYLGLASGVVLLTLVLALGLAIGLQRQITAPLNALEAAARRVSEHQEFSFRVPNQSRESEVGALIAAFNQMLARIEQREQALDEANAALRRLAHQSSLIEENERERLSAELHDGPMQKLALAQIQLTAAEQAQGEARPDADSIEVDEQRAAGISLMRDAMRELRTLQFELSPPVLQQRGLAAALAWLAGDTRARWGIDIRCEVIEPVPALGREVSIMLFQCARELVHNIIKHASAGSALIRLADRDHRLELLVKDDGVGFDLEGAMARLERGEVYGLFSIRERMRLVGGHLAIEAGTKGTRVSLSVPWSK